MTPRSSCVATNIAMSGAMRESASPQKIVGCAIYAAAAAVKSRSARTPPQGYSIHHLNTLLIGWVPTHAGSRKFSSLCFRWRVSSRSGIALRTRFAGTPPLRAISTNPVHVTELGDRMRVRIDAHHAAEVEGGLVPAEGPSGFRLLTQSRDSKLKIVLLVHVFRRAVHKAQPGVDLGCPGAIDPRSSSKFERDGPEICPPTSLERGATFPSVASPRVAPQSVADQSALENARFEEIAHGRAAAGSG